MTPIDALQVWPVRDALARLATLNNNYTPAHRFEVAVAPTLEELDTKLVDPHSLKEAWLEVFPEGQVQMIMTEELSQGIDLNHPGWWISTAGDLLLVYRGIDKQGLCTLEDPQQQQVQLTRAELLGRGNLSLVHVQPIKDELHKRPESASEWFIHAIGKRRADINDSIVASVVMNLLAVATALYSMQVYDRVIPSQSNATLIVLTIGVMLSIGFEYTLKQIRAKLVDQSFKNIDNELSLVFFNQALRIRLDARPKDVGTFISELRSFEGVRAFMTSATLFVLADAPFALFFTLIIMYIGGVLGLIPLVFLVIMLVIGYSLSKRLQYTNQMLAEETNRKQGFLMESMDGIESVKATGGEAQLLHRWHQLQMQLSPRELQVRDISTTASSMTAAIQQVTYVATVAVGAMLIHDSKLTMGGLIACSILGGRILAPLMQIPQLLVQWGQIRYSLEHLNKIMAMPSDQKDREHFVTPSSFESKLVAEQVEFGYQADQPFLQIPQLQFKAGQSIAVLGRVGSGKSTLLKVLSGLYFPSAGRVLFSEIDIKQLSPDLMREQIGYLPQDVRLIKGTLKENLTLGLPFATDSEILAACEKVGLDRLIKSHPAGLGLSIAEGGMGLSGGQKQMVALARLFLANPRVMLLDEPTASLDRDLELKVLKELFAWMSPERILVIVTHKPQVLQYVSQIMILESGKVARYGERQEMLNLLQGKAPPPNNTTGTVPVPSPIQ